MKLQDTVVVITGGSKGFGKALAEALHNERANVIITSDNEPELKATAEQIGISCVVADVTSFDDHVSVADYANNTFGKIDVWINNAGIQIAPSAVEEVDIAKLHKLFAINFFGYFYGCMAALRTMKRQGAGVIININSTAGLGGKPGLSAYVSSKFAIKGLSESIREEVTGSNIELYQIFPGGMKTDIYKEKVPADIESYMDVAYAIDKVIGNLKLDNPEPDLVIKRPLAD